MITGIGLVVVILCLGGASFAEDYRNQTITCVFQEYAKCYGDIASLGANFSARYDETNAQINTTCRFEPSVKQCVSNLITSCNSVSSRQASVNVTAFIHQLCTEKSVEHLSFLNSSKCYNQFQDKRVNCVEEFSSGNKTDAKSLCCSNMRTQECLRNEMDKVCPKNATEFHKHLMESYTSHHSVLCEQYLKLCNNGDRLVSAMAVLMATIASLMLQKL